MNLNDLVDKIYVINVDSQIENWEMCKKQFQFFGVNNYERFPAIVPNGGKDYIDRIMGCKLSHYEIYRKAKENKYSRTLILEDDFECNLQMNDRLCIIDDFLKTNKWDLFYLGGSHGKDFKMQSLKITNDIYMCVKTFTTHAYIINQNIIDKLIEVSEKTMDIKMGDPRGYADNLLFDNIQPLKNCYHIHPNLIYQRAGFSFIQQGFRDYFWIKKQ